jgi:hypothetical protein
MSDLPSQFNRILYTRPAEPTPQSLAWYHPLRWGKLLAWWRQCRRH